MRPNQAMQLTGSVRHGLCYRPADLPAQAAPRSACRGLVTRLVLPGVYVKPSFKNRSRTYWKDACIHNQPG